MGPDVIDQSMSAKVKHIFSFICNKSIETYFPLIRIILNTNNRNETPQDVAYSKEISLPIYQWRKQLTMYVISDKSNTQNKQQRVDFEFQPKQTESKRKPESYPSYSKIPGMLTTF